MSSNLSGDIWQDLNFALLNLQLSEMITLYILHTNLGKYNIIGTHFWFSFTDGAVAVHKTKIDTGV